MARQQPGLACEECRRRKARCDRVRPQCGICTDSGRQCVYVDKRSPRGPKKGQLKELRSRMAIIEQQLASQGPGNDESSKVLESVEMSPEQDQPGGLPGHKAYTETDDDIMRRSSYGSTSTSTANMSNLEDQLLGEIPPGHPPRAWSDNKSFVSGSTTLYSHRPTSSMPTSPVKQSLGRMNSRQGFEVSEHALNDLDLLYFERVHPIIPMIHKEHYFSWARGEDTSPTRVCLRLAVRAIAAAMSTGFDEIADVLYARTRSTLETLDVQEPAEFPWATRPRSPHSRIDHELIQAWLLLAHCEFLRKSEQEALLTSGRAFTLLQLSSIFNVDMQNTLDSNTNNYRAAGSFGPSSTTTGAMPNGVWVRTEEMRRTIWTAFLLDRLSSMLNQRPPIIHEDIIYARLPMPEEDFQNGQQPVTMGFLSETVGNADRYAALPPFAQCVSLASLFERCIAHRRLSQSVSPPGSEIESQSFWARHQWLAAVTESAIKAQTQTPPLEQPSNQFATTNLKHDIMSVFNQVLAYSTCVFLSNTAEERPWQTVDDQMISLTYKQTAYQAAGEVVGLMQTLPRVAFFRMHIFLSSAICIVARFLGAPTTQLVFPDRPNRESIRCLLFALRSLGDVNRMARDILVKLEAEFAQNIPSTIPMTM